ncbi:MAG: hypothetical protein KF767_10765 [Bdellovibrionaceae bacterium]|nr:hypothetical protein [Pseudobdellovibrionaceae bacterium]
MSAQAERKRRWVRDEMLRARVVEIPSPGNLIVDIEGFLFRVANRSVAQPSVGDVLRLQVQAIEPLELKIVGGAGFARLA